MRLRTVVASATAVFLLFGAGAALARSHASAPYTLSGPTSETSAWPKPATGFTWGGGAGSVNETYKGAGNPETATYTWTVPSSIPADGAKGSITVVAAAGGEVWAPGFSINGVLVGCSGIANTPSYGTGCAEGDHAAVGVSLQPGQSRTVTQEFLIKPGLGKVTVVVPGFSQQFVYTATRNGGATTTTSSSPNSSGLKYVFSAHADFTEPHSVGAIHFTGRGGFSLTHLPSANATAAAFDAYGTATAEVVQKKGTYTFGLQVKSVRFAKEGVDNKVTVVYTVTRSLVSCAPVGSAITVTMLQSNGYSELAFAGFCNVRDNSFSHKNVTISLKLK
ncbi:MAG TPA: hypothetical protein VFM96_11440 [Gaiellaceae bacterium]|nr:hypothetical protein [Gaiellaceae bacterium]